MNGKSKRTILRYVLFRESPYVNTDHPELTGISPTTTAVELLFLPTLSFLLPQEQWPRVYELLTAAPETTTLAGVIAARIAVNPTAVADQDPAIKVAIATVPGISPLPAILPIRPHSSRSGYRRKTAMLPRQPGWPAPSL